MLVYSFCLFIVFFLFACLLLLFFCLFIVVFLVACLMCFFLFACCLFVCLFVEEAINSCSERYADLGASQLKVISSPHPIFQMAGPRDEAYCWFQAQASPGIACVTSQL